MRKRSIILYWLLLLVPTILIGTAAFQLLRHEQERIDQQARFSAQERAQAIGDTLQVTPGQGTIRWSEMPLSGVPREGCYHLNRGHLRQRRKEGLFPVTRHC
jgi:hypothetical protein